MLHLVMLGGKAGTCPLLMGLFSPSVELSPSSEPACPLGAQSASVSLRTQL